MKKSFYVFLSSLLGSLLFLTLHRLLVFGLLILISSNPQKFYNRVSFLEIASMDFFTLILVLMLGAWYGIWLGLKWYEAVYERGEHGGFVDQAIANYWPAPKSEYNLQTKVQSLAEELKDDVLKLEHLATTIKPVIKKAEPIKRRAVRRKSDSKRSAIS